MKYKDYLIIPIIAIYIVMTSFAYVNVSNENEDGTAAPTASVSPVDINLGDDTWYAEGTRNSDCINAATVSKLSIKDMHLLCSTDEGKSYDLIFVDSMTAYDCNTGVYYERADYDTLVDELLSGKFINESNYTDYYTFSSNGKSAEYFGEKVYKGKWSLDTSDSLVIYDNTCKGYMNFAILFNVYGDVSGISYGGKVYNLVT